MSYKLIKFVCKHLNPLLIQIRIHILVWINNNYCSPPMTYFKAPTGRVYAITPCGEGKYQIFALWFLTQLTTTGTGPSGQTQTPHLYVLLLTDDIVCVWATSQSNHPYLGCMDNVLVWLLLRALGL